MGKNEITIYDLATKLNLSAATISRGLKDHPAISNKTKQKIFGLAHEMGYRANNFASSLRSQKTNTIGIIVPRLDSSFMSTVIAGIEKVLNMEGFNLIISQSLEQHEKEVVNARTMFNNRVDGLLVSLTYDTPHIRHFEETFISRNVPVVFFDRVAYHKDCTSVTIDNRKAACLITQHLIQQGCRNIVHLAPYSNSNVYTDRYNGFVDAHVANGLPVQPENKIHAALTMDGGATVARQIYEMKQRPDGVFAANDACAVGCMQALLEYGISIPADIAFAGFNNDPISSVIVPNLTTVNYNGYIMGVTVAQNLVDQIKENGKVQSIHQLILHADMLVRASSLRNNL